MDLAKFSLVQIQKPISLEISIILKHIATLIYYVLPTQIDINTGHKDTNDLIKLTDNEEKDFNNQRRHIF